jgi:hypothetical protein
MNDDKLANTGATGIGGFSHGITARRGAALLGGGLDAGFGHGVRAFAVSEQQRRPRLSNSLRRWAQFCRLCSAG